jgi:hypothetical protein
VIGTAQTIDEHRRLQLSVTAAANGTQTAKLFVLSYFAMVIFPACQEALDSLGSMFVGSP